MARLSSSLINNFHLLIRSGRRYASSGTESGKTQSAAASTTLREKKAFSNASGKVTEKYVICENNKDDGKNNKKGFWMRDPRTGNWIPETHFDDVDVAELRHKLLSNKH